MSNSISRRSFLSKSSIYGGALAMSVKLPLAEAAAKLSTGPEVINAGQWRTIEAMTARVIPTDDQPGALEANCVNFIDKALANEEAAAAAGVLQGLSLLDRLCETHYGRPFVGLEAAQQDAVLSSLQAGTAQPWATDDPLSGDFFEVIRSLTIIGFLAEPKYGGNADMVGWKVAGYPGPRHHGGGYSPEQMIGEEAIITVWGEKL